MDLMFYTALQQKITFKIRQMHRTAFALTERKPATAGLNNHSKKG